MIGLGIAFTPCCKCDEKGKCNICELTYHRNGQLVHHADLVEVRRGEWKQVSEKYPRYVCTYCNHLFNNKEYKYCPNCGAYMRGKNNV